MENNVQITTSNELISETYSIQDFINVIVDLEKKLQQISNEIKDNNWHQNKDSRMLFILFTKDLNLNTILLLSILSDSTKNLQDIEWYKNKLPFFKRSIETNNNFVKFCNDRINNIFNYILSDFFLSYFFEFETRIRNILRSLQIVKNKEKNTVFNGNENITKVFNCLFQDFLMFEKKEFEIAIFFSAVRNSIHNSGIFFSPKDEDLQVDYRDKTYNFAYGKPVNFLSLELKKIMMLDLLDLFSKIINNPKIKKIELIKDPVADIDFK